MENSNIVSSFIHKGFEKRKQLNINLGQHPPWEQSSPDCNIVDM
jgi:hypothetical protein